MSEISGWDAIGYSIALFILVCTIAVVVSMVKKNKS